MTTATTHATTLLLLPFLAHVPTEVELLPHRAAPTTGPTYAWIPWRSCRAAPAPAPSMRTYSAACKPPIRLSTCPSLGRPLTSDGPLSPDQPSQCLHLALHPKGPVPCRAHVPPPSAFCKAAPALPTCPRSAACKAAPARSACPTGTPCQAPPCQAALALPRAKPPSRCHVTSCPLSATCLAPGAALLQPARQPGQHTCADVGPVVQ